MATDKLAKQETELHDVVIESRQTAVQLEIDGMRIKGMSNFSVSYMAGAYVEVSVTFLTRSVNKRNE